MSPATQFLDVTVPGRPDRKIAYRQAPGARADAPGLVWLSGFKSDMASTKVAALAPWAEARGAAFLRFDYSGHGESGGRIEDFTIGDWLAESLAAFEALSRGPQILVGSSMGGWLALLLARALVARGEGTRLKAIVLIAPAWDMTEELMWKRFSPEARATLERDGVFHRPSEYGEPYALTRTLIEEGRNHLLLGSGFDPGCPVRILQGLRDADVPWEHAVRLVDQLGGDDVRLTLVKDAEHRLSRDQDLALLMTIIAEFLA
ncbi:MULTISPECIES: alpha/beta hydrolase [Rhodomicrobium]|uniref:alpha/beta hydrolase n=1 Tax=Rhodomicrobium TaxID=1068 RepID=UPI000B4BDCA7|nr:MULTISPECIES: alpha/beta hydrolase [Rhodomicrobium]